MKTIPLILAAAYLLILHLLMGIRTEHIVIISFILGCYYIHPKSRQFVIHFLPFFLFGALYDLLRVYPKGWAGSIHVEWPYQIEKMFFGLPHPGGRITPNEFFQTHHLAVLDVITAIAYSLHIVVPIVFAFWTWIKDRELSRQFVRAFLIVNLLAFVTYVGLPVAPPWYVEQYGLVPGDWSIIGSAAGLLRFDQLFGVSYFQDVYAKGAWVFGAVPSMHAGFPPLVILFAHRFSRKLTRPLLLLVPLYTFMGLVWLSAVYLRHHYVIDLLAGLLYVLAVFHLRRHELQGIWRTL